VTEEQYLSRVSFSTITLSINDAQRKRSLLSAGVLCVIFYFCTKVVHNKSSLLVKIILSNTQAFQLFTNQYLIINYLQNILKSKAAKLEFGRSRILKLKGVERKKSLEVMGELLIKFRVFLEGKYL
jgi:hypothetical protein